MLEEIQEQLKTDITELLHSQQDLLQLLEQNRQHSRQLVLQTVDGIKEHRISLSVLSET
jgi:hypothetical protein